MCEVIAFPKSDKDLGVKSSIAREAMLQTLLSMLQVAAKHGVIGDYRACTLAMLRAYENHITPEAKARERTHG